MVSEPMPSDRTPARPKSGRRWLTILLFVSLVANVFLLGLFGGRLFHRHDWFDRQTEYAQQMGPIAGRALERLVRPLDAADREVVIDTVRGHELRLVGRDRDAAHDHIKAHGAAPAAHAMPDMVPAYHRTRARDDGAAHSVALAARAREPRHRLCLVFRCRVL